MQYVASYLQASKCFTHPTAFQPFYRGNKDWSSANPVSTDQQHRAILQSKSRHIALDPLRQNLIPCPSSAWALVSNDQQKPHRPLAKTSSHAGCPPGHATRRRNEPGTLTRGDPSDGCTSDSLARKIAATPRPSRSLSLRGFSVSPHGALARVRKPSRDGCPASLHLLPRTAPVSSERSGTPINHVTGPRHASNNQSKKQQRRR
jgi:hypothetical protein